MLRSYSGWLAVFFSDGRGYRPARTSVKALIQAREIRTDEEAVHVGGGGGYTCHRLWRGRQISEIANVMPVKPATHMQVVMYKTILCHLSTRSLR